MTGGVSSHSSRAKDEESLGSCVPFRASGEQRGAERAAVVSVPYCSPGNTRRRPRRGTRSPNARSRPGLRVSRHPRRLPRARRQSMRRNARRRIWRRTWAANARTASGTSGRDDGIMQARIQPATRCTSMRRHPRAVERWSWRSVRVSSDRGGS